MKTRQNGVGETRAEVRETGQMLWLGLWVWPWALLLMVDSAVVRLGAIVMCWVCVRAANSLYNREKWERRGIALLKRLPR